jgi:hypothetical protein
MAFPDFLIVGAMKAGTTTLARDLSLHPDIFIPEDKEPETLVRFRDRLAIERDYDSLFPKSVHARIKGEASTAYTKRPDHEGVAEWARACGMAGLRIVYMRRDPVRRIVSHYLHERQHKRFSGSLHDALRQHRELIDYSRYDWQIAPWKKQFGEAAVIEIDLEDYASRRLDVLHRVLRHLGADPARLPPIDLSVVLNSAGETKHIDNRLLDAVIHSHFYRRRVKTLIPRSWRDAGRKAILPRAPKLSAEIDEADRQFIVSELACAVEEIR